MSLFGHKQKTVEPDVIPTTVEQAIPIRDVCEDGIFLVGRNLWSKTYRFTDVNYATASKEDKEGMFFAYSEILNTFDAGAMSKITVNNRRLNQTKFRENNMLELQGDSLDKYRNEYNRILAGNANLSNGITQDKYLTVTVEKKTEEEARAYFNRISAEFAALFAKLGSKLEEVTAEEKLRILFDFFHYGAEDDYHYDAGLYTQRGYSFKDAIAPDCLEFRTDYFKMDGRYGRVLYLRDYANFIKDSFIAELTDIDRGMILSIDASPITTEATVKLGENKLLSVETNISNWQRKQNSNNNFSATVPYDMERQREESREFLNDLVARDQRMIPALITLVHTADTKEQLDADTESIRQCARKHLCSLNILRWQQLEGLNTVLPYGAPKLDIRRTLTTESLAVFMPFRVQEVCHTGGIYYANNAISKNLIMVNRAELLNGNSFITGVSGSGTFANETNVDTKNRLICYDIHDLGRALMPIGMLVVLDNILNRITANKARGRKTYIFIDEIYLLFKHEYSANFLFTLWKRVRKYGAFITGITQNVEDLLQSHTARTMLANSELVVMLNQAATDREELASLMGISDLQMGYITNVDAGHGLVKIGGALVPFVNKVPKDTKLYALMTTKFGES